MKRTLFALALLVPAIASATVELDFWADGEQITKLVFTELESEQSFDRAGMNHSFTLENEGLQSAKFTVKISDGSQECSCKDVSYTYNEEYEVACGGATGITVKASSVLPAGQDDQQG